MDKKTHSLCERVPRVVGSSRAQGTRILLSPGTLDQQASQKSLNQRQFQPRQRMVPVQGEVEGIWARELLLYIFASSQIPQGAEETGMG